MDITSLYLSQGALLAPDTIPLHFGDTLGEYQATFTGGILLDRRHEGRFVAQGTDVVAWLDRICTNKLTDLTPNTGKPTLFTNATARILDRAWVVMLSPDRLLILTEPNRGDALMAYLQKNILYGDKVTLTNWHSSHHQLALHGAGVDTFVHAHLLKDSHSHENTTQLDITEDTRYMALEGSINDAPLWIIRQKPLVGGAWTLITPADDVPMVWKSLVDMGKSHGIMPSGGLVYNTIRIYAGRPGVGRELTTDYIPLELGLWDEVSFSKGCYTGQEILARMESRNKLARVLMRLHLSQVAEANTPIFYAGKQVGEVTSSVVAPDGTLHAMAVVKTSIAQVGAVVQIGAVDGASATLGDYLGEQPRMT